MVLRLLSRLLPGRRGAVLAVAATLGLAACGGAGDGAALSYVARDPAPQQTFSIAVLPMANLTNQTEAGMIVGLLVESALYDAGVFSLHEGTAVRAALAEAKIDAGRLGNDIDSRLLAELLDVDGVLTGAVGEYGYKFSLREEPAVGVTLRLVDREGRVLYADSDAELGGGLLARDSVSHAAARLVDRMVGRLADGVQP